MYMLYNGVITSRLPHHEQSHLVFGDGLQVGNAERLGEGGASSEGLRRLHRGREAVQPRPLAGAPHGRAGLWRAVAEVGWRGGTAQELVQVEPHGQRGQALHVGAVDQLLATHHVGLEGEEPKETSTAGVSEFYLTRTNFYREICGKNG